MSAAQPVQTDILDPDLYERAVPYELFARLRQDAPVSWQDAESGQPYWAVTKHADVVAVSRDPATFSSYAATCLSEDFDDESIAQQRLMMLNQDPPEHTRLRALVNRGFNPRMINQLQPRIEQMCADLVEEMAEAGHADFVRDIAAPLPLAVIADLLGAEHDARDRIFEWSNRMVGFSDPELQTTPEDGQVAALEMFAYANELGTARRAEPREDIVSTLIAPDRNGAVLGPLEFELFFLMLAVAGNETTRNAASGGMLAFLDHPDQWQLLRADPSLLPSAVEEVLRYVTPVIQFRRTAMRDVELRGARIAKGDKVIIFYSSANHDEELFAEPQRFDITRDPNPHLSFGGGGPHFCLGAHLARIELRALFAALLERAPDLELAAPPRRLRSNFINGIKEMQVRCPR